MSTGAGPAGDAPPTGDRAPAGGPALAAGEMWDRRFAEQAWPREPDPFLVELVAGLPAGRALDIGSGPGRNSLWLASQGWQVTAVDASRVGLEQASRTAEERGLALTTVLADVTTWQPPQLAYELVVVANLHPGMAALRTVLAGAARAIVPSGHLFVVGHDLTNLGRSGPPDPTRLLTVERLRAAMPASLQVASLERRGRAAAAEDLVVLAWATKEP